MRYRLHAGLYYAPKKAPNLDESHKVALKQAPNPLKGAKDKHNYSFSPL
ncbi:MAG: hypothetical protein RIS84_179 [Pseudomonadota bacterium]|jgi:hypothetical protein